MSINKNFRINRIKQYSEIKLEKIKIGDMFEREGSLHMRVNNCHSRIEDDRGIWVCNINTGSVWKISKDQVYRDIENCVISYDIKY